MASLSPCCTIGAYLPVPRFLPFLAHFPEPLLVQFEDPVVHRENGQYDESLEAVEDDVSQDEDLLSSVKHNIVLGVWYDPRDGKLQR